MRRFSPLVAAFALTAFTSSLYAAARPHHHTSTHAMVSRSTHMHHTERVISERSPNYGISGERASEIQAALIRQGYMTGEPTGTWDAITAAAMTKLQLDNGWQTKMVPDSRALIKLGLGPGSVSPSTSAFAPAAPSSASSAIPPAPSIAASPSTY